MSSMTPGAGRIIGENEGSVVFVVEEDQLISRIDDLEQVMKEFS